VKTPAPYSPSKVREALRRIALERENDDDIDMATQLRELAATSLDRSEDVMQAVEMIGGRARAQALRAEVWW
jgi:hypothetical protein